MSGEQSLGEWGRIDRYLAPLTHGVPGAWQLGDDAAWIPRPDQAGWVVCMDTIVAGIHFFPDDPPEQIARYLLRVNLSDMAAMGGMPHIYFLSLALPSRYDDGWFARFARGLKEDQEGFGLSLAGGDSVAVDGPAVLSLTMMGQASHPIRRSGACAGDMLVVSGQLGDAALGVHKRSQPFPLSAKDEAFLERRRLLPHPRVCLGLALAGLAHAAIDISDGLVADLEHLCRESGVGAEIRTDTLPLSPVGQRILDRNPELLEVILTGGDDYELLFACARSDWPEISRHADELGVLLTHLGDFNPGQRVVVMTPEGEEIPLLRSGYRHD